MKILRAAVAALPLLLAGLPAHAALADSQNASVGISDSGFSPAVVAIPVGGTVTWTNQGTTVHTATSSPATGGNPTSTPAPFDSGGMGPGQTFSWTFSRAGTYLYSSAPDCLNGNVTAGFTCGNATVTVGDQPSTAVAAPGLAPGVGPAVLASAPPPPASATVQQSATVNITDSGFSPASVAISTGGTPSTGGSVTFVNTGTQLHTAVSTNVQMESSRNQPEIFDTGGLQPGESKTFNFTYGGTYSFSSATDCLNGNSNQAFNCSGAYSLQVLMRAPIGATTSAVAPPFTGSTVYFRDGVGYDPASLTVKAGQTVTWLNLTSSVHSVVSDSAAQPFDSGGLGTGQTFSVTFQAPGTYKYHSSTDPIWSGNQIAGYQNTGTVTVTA